MRTALWSSILVIAAFSGFTFTSQARGADKGAPVATQTDGVGMAPGRFRAGMAGQGAPDLMAETQVSASAPAYSFIDYPGTPYTLAFTINPGALKGAKTAIVGVAGPGEGPDGGASTSFLVTIAAGKNAATVYTFQPVTAAGASITVGAVNDHMEMTGQTNDASPHGFMIKNGVYTQFDVPFAGATFTSPNAINNDGVIAGYWGAADGSQHGFTLKNGVFTMVPDYPGSTIVNVLGINSFGDLSGNLYDSARVLHGFLLRNGVYTLFDPPGSVYTLGAGLNDLDEVVGFYCTSVCSVSHPSVVHGFAWKNGVITTIDIPQAAQTEPLSVNNAGLIAGYYQESGTGFLHGFTVQTP